MFGRLVLLTTLCLRLVARRLDRRLTQSWMGLLLVLVFLLPILDVDRVRAALGAQDPLTAAWANTLLIAGLALISRAGLRAVLLGPHMAALVRQPIPPLRWSLALVVPMATAGIPLLAIAALHPGPAPVLRVVSWGALWAPVAIAVAGHSATRSVVAVAVAAVLMAVTAGPVGPWPLLAVAWAAWASGRWMVWGATRGPSGTMSLSWRPRTPIGAVVQRDVLCLLRTEARGVAAAPAAGLVAGAMMAQLQRKETFAPDGLTDSAAVLLVMGAIPALIAVVGRLLERLRGQLIPPGWPVSAGLRAASLVLLAGLAASPALAAVGAASPLPRAPLLGLEALALAVGAALLCHTERLGWFFAWCALVALSAAVAWPVLVPMLLAAAVALHRDLDR